MSDGGNRGKGRPATGRKRPWEIHTYVDGEELAEARWLAEAWRVSLAEVMRRALREAARREKVTGGGD